jgi:hypothetical protein
VKAPEPAVRHPARHTSLANPGRSELRASQDAVLAGRDRCQSSFCGKFQTLRADNLPTLARGREESAGFRRNVAVRRAKLNERVQPLSGSVVAPTLHTCAVRS